MVVWQGANRPSGIWWPRASRASACDGSSVRAERSQALAACAYLFCEPTNIFSGMAAQPLMNGQLTFWLGKYA